MIGVIVTFLTIVATLVVFIGALRDFGSMVLNIPFIQRKKFSKEDIARFSTYLSDNGYYQNLTAVGKTRFMDRLVRFMVNKEFSGKQGLIVTEEMRVEISASAVRLTYGLDQFILPNFDTIWIFPEAFVFGFDRLKMKGGTTPNGRVMLSWPDFVSGNANPTNRINLGLHEFAHALKLEVADGDEFDERFTPYFAEWEKEGKLEMLSMRSKKNNMLRNYASVNIDEFFAVSVEHFFERPNEFKELLPQLYEHFVWLLNQDPINTIDDYRYLGKSKIISPAENLVIRDKWHWSLNMLLSGIFFGIPALIYFASQNDVSTVDIFLFIGLLSIINMFSWDYFKERRILSIYQFIFYSIFGVAIWGTTILLLANYEFPIGKPIIEEYDVIHVERGVDGENNLVRYDLQYEAYKDEPLLRSFFIRNVLTSSPHHVTFEFQRGILGIKALHHVEPR